MRFSFPFTAIDPSDWQIAGGGVIGGALFAAVALAVSIESTPADAQTLAPPIVGVPAVTLSQRSDPADPYALFVSEASLRFGVPERWIVAVMRAESAGDPAATSRVGAMGLMQVMPATWTGLRARYGFGPNAYDPRENILAGAAYLREMHDRYGSIVGMLAAYNAGPGRYDDHLATGRALPHETRAYIAAIAPVIGGVVPASVLAAAPPRVVDPAEAPIFIARDGQAVAASVQPTNTRAASLTPAERSLVALQSSRDVQPSGQPGRAPGAVRSSAESTSRDSIFVRSTTAGGPDQ